MESIAANSVKIVCQFYQSPGDTLVATAAIASLKQTYGERFLVDVEGTEADSIFTNNPHITRHDRNGALTVRMENPLINEWHLPFHFMASYCQQLTQSLGVEVKLKVNRPELYLSEQELSWIPRIEELTGKRIPYWLVNAGIKNDFTVKGWPLEYFQEVVDYFRGKIQFVQIGRKEHDHKPLKGVIDEVGQTDDDTRKLIRFAGHPLCQGCLTGESFPWHLLAAFGKPAVCVASGFLPRHWVEYQTGRLLSKHGCLPCCQGGACGRSRVVALGDGDTKDGSLCELPMVSFERPVGRCMAMITPQEVIDAIMAYYLGGILRF